MISKNSKFLSFTNITNIIVTKKINILFVSLKLNCLLILSIIKKNILIELNKKDADSKNLSKSLSAIILLLEKPPPETIENTKLTISNNL